MSLIEGEVIEAQVAYRRQVAQWIEDLAAKIVTHEPELYSLPTANLLAYFEQALRLEREKQHGNE